MEKNIYYLFSINDKLFTHLSVILNQTNSFNRYYGLASAKDKVFRSKLFSNITYLSDLAQQKNGIIEYDYLKKIETDYDVKLADLIHADRHLMRFKKKERLYLAQQIIKKFIAELVAYNITLVFSEGIDDFISLFASQYCKYSGVKFLYPCHSGLENRFFYTDRLDGGPIGLEEAHKKACSQLSANGEADLAVNKYLQNYILKKKQPEYLKKGGLLFRILNRTDIKDFKNYVVSYFQDRNGFHFDRHPFLTPLYRLQRIIRALQYKNYLRQIKLDDLTGKKYIIYPLHLHPEVATLIQGRRFNNQIEIIKMLSKSLPVDMLLIVKEHKVSIGRRPLDFYKQIAACHNVFLVDDAMDVYKLLNGSNGLATIASTMGLEALLLQKPVLCFGEKYYNISANVYCVTDYCKLGEYINKLLTHQFDANDRQAFFSTVLTKSYDLGFYTPKEFPAESVKKMAKHVIEFTQL